MRKKQTSLRNLRNDLANTKGSYLSNASTVVKLDTLLPKSLIPRKNIVMMKNPTIIKNIKRGKPNRKINSIRKRKNIYSKDNSSSSDMTEDDDTEVLFVGIETQTDTTVDNNYGNEENPKVEGEFDLEGELISALEELRRCRRKNKLLKEQLLDYKEGQRSREEEASKSIKKTKKKTLLI
jgi:hypothetical protein